MVIVNRCIKFHSQEDEKRLLARRMANPARGLLGTEWKSFLETASTEAQVQNFLENHPGLLPGLRDFHNGPLHDIVVTKFPLGADYRTDFAFVTRHSMALQFTFVEIEDPTKPIFNKDDSFSQKFNHARQQVSDWVGWAERNITLLADMFGPMFDTYNASEDRKTVRGYLVYGRRGEIEADRRRRERWQSVQASSDARVWVMSYDRLGPAPAGDEADLIVCTYENRGFYVKGAVL
jgi:hypothetical protein